MSTDLLQETRHRLHSQGGRMTSQRELILAALDSLDTHPTAEELHAIVATEDPNLNLSTVYRTLRWLEQEGLVSTRRFDEDRRHDRFDPMLPSQHHHFLCTACGSVIEFEHPAISVIQADFESQHGARVESINLTFYGLCAGCTRDAKDVDPTVEHELSHES
jgi:Fe2+ or Zn2+ uptake regulation protein